jgi:hypothetical protein
MLETSKDQKEIKDIVLLELGFRAVWKQEFEEPEKVMFKY